MLFRLLGKEIAIYRSVREPTGFAPTRALCLTARVRSDERLIG